MPTTTARQEEEQRLAKGMSHPDRANALKIFNERTASANEIAEELGLDVKQISYHVKRLLELELIEWVDEKRRRGAYETFYRAVERPLVSDEEWDAIPEDRRPGLVGEFFQAIIDQGVEAIRAGTVGNDSKFWIGPTPMSGDEQLLEELVALHNEVHERALEAQANYAERSVKGEAGKEINIVSALACFRGAPS
jgi:predicted transcriptional regulator